MENQFSKFEKYFCPHCQKEIKNGQEVTSIMSGSAHNVQMICGHINGTVNKIENAIVFHDECFLEIAGIEYYPRLDGLN